MITREDLESIAWPEVCECIGLTVVERTEASGPFLEVLLKVFRAGAVYAWDRLAPDMHEAIQDASAYKKLSDELTARLSIAQKVIAQKNAERR